MKYWVESFEKTFGVDQVVILQLKEEHFAREVVFVHVTEIGAFITERGVSEFVPWDSIRYIRART